MLIIRITCLSLSVRIWYTHSAQKTNINTRAEWFDLLLNAFAKMIKANPNVDGVRTYFARHTSYGDALYPEYVDENAFVIVPTQTIPNSNPLISRQDLFDCSMAVYDPTSAESRLRKRTKQKRVQYLRKICPI